MTWDTYRRRPFYNVYMFLLIISLLKIKSVWKFLIDCHNKRQMKYNYAELVWMHNSKYNEEKETLHGHYMFIICLQHRRKEKL